MAADDTDDYAQRTRAIDRLGILLGARVRREVDLAPYTTYKVGGPASLLVTVRSIDDLHAVSSALREQRVPLLVIGRGSNLLVSDEGFAGLAIVLGEFAQDIVLPESPATTRGTAVCHCRCSHDNVPRGVSRAWSGVSVFQVRLAVPCV